MSRKRKLDPPIPIPPRVRSLIGCRFGRLLVKYFAGMDAHRKSHWCCECDRGAIVRVSGARLIGTTGKGAATQKSCGCLRADPGIRRAARLTMPRQRRAEICAKMRKNVRHRRPAYALPVERAAELLGITTGEAELLARDGEIGYTMRGGHMWLSSKDVMARCAERERVKNRCVARTILRPTQRTKPA